MNKKKKLIPELRFPEFKDESEWNCKPIGEVFNSFSGGTPSTSEKKYYGGEIPFIRSAEINRERTELFITDEGLNNSSTKLVYKGDLLVALYGANSGDSAISKLNGAINQAILCLQSDYSNVFTFNFLTYKKEYIVSRFIQGGQGNLSGDIIKSILIPFPEAKEQQKIAFCLSSLDEVIAAHSQKLELLKEHKRGLMQKLFPQEGEQVPKYRFKEFSGQWMNMGLGDLTIKVGSGVTPLGGESNYRRSGRPFVRSQNVSWGTFLLNGIVFIDEETHRNSINTEIESEDVLLNITGASIGRSAVANESVSGGNVNQHVCIIRTQRELLNPFFLNQYLISDLGQKQINSFQAGGNRQGLNFGQIRSFSIAIPSLQEQEKVASCLSALDELITSQTEKIEQLKLHKKGLMQGLFPKMND